MFRAECKAGTALGKMACSLLSSGKLVPDEITDQIVAGRIAQTDCRDGFLLDGYPRTVPQAMHFSALLRQRGLPDPLVIHLDVPDHDLIARLTARRQCPQCKRIYNLLSQPPQADGLCDDDGARLIAREDDREAVIVERLRAYEELTGPILKWYGDSAVCRVNGSAPPDQVRRSIDKAVEPRLGRSRPVTLSV
jgi:adenylate kinase